jgi:uncharacterized protein (DUF4415 family)
MSKDGDYTDAPPEVAEAIESAQPVPDFLPPPEELARSVKRPVSIRLDADVVAWFKRFGKGYQTRINEVLRSYMEHYR